MNAEETAVKAKPFDEGDELYQQRARAALPLLVRQAKAQKTIFYADLAEELGISNPRNLNFVLGSVGRTLIKLGQTKGMKIPPIQCLVVNQADELPGEGVDSFIEKEVVRGMTRPQRRAVIARLLQEVFTFPRWNEVLDTFGMKPAPQDYSKLLRNIAASGCVGGESEHHIRLKQFVASHPDLLDLPRSVAKGVNEYRLPSGDELDVLFRKGDEWVVVEVKSHISSDEDLVRGFFQCVKYQAVMEAFLLSTNRPPEVRTALVITRKLPGSLLPLKNVLGIEVVQIAEPPEPTGNPQQHA